MCGHAVLLSVCCARTIGDCMASASEFMLAESSPTHTKSDAARNQTCTWMVVSIQAKENEWITGATAAAETLVPAALADAGAGEEVAESLMMLKVASLLSV